MMQLRKLLREYLTLLGCDIEEKAGIWHITTPEGNIWTMTPPNLEKEVK